MIRTYAELITLPSFKERFEYLVLHGSVGRDTFGYDRYLNQILYNSSEWRHLRDRVILRDNGCDLGCEGFELYVNIIVHHLNPITVDDVIRRSSKVFDMNNLITTSFDTHNAIHYGSINNLVIDVPMRQPNDTCPWKQ